jgi:uncharacterized protein (UPF0261 family)/ABC-type branched-subunit amino acid transport system ATPase component
MAGPEPLLRVAGLHVYYGRSHALQGVSLALDSGGVLAVVGRNGMGKTTLCNAVMGLVPAASGAVAVRGRPALGLPPHAVSSLGVAYVPQGRRVWPSLTVEEHLRLVARRGGPWTVDRVYDAFPRLAERRRSGGSQLSGGEQQMLAIGRALLRNPSLLVMDEPTEGLAPVVVQQVEAMLRRLAEEGSIAVLLVEQNLGVALDVAGRVAVMTNGRLAHEMEARALAADPALQQRLLGVGRHAHEETDEAAPEEEPPRVFAVVRRAEDAPPPSPAEGPLEGAAYSRAAAPTRFAADNWRPAPSGRAGLLPAPPPPPSPPGAPEGTIPTEAPPTVAELTGRAAYVVGTFDTKARELFFLRDRLRRLGLDTVTVDLSTGRLPSPADVGPAEVARHHPRGAEAVFSTDRGAAVTAMAQAFERFVATRRDLGGVISAGGSGGTSLATAGMRRLAVGVPKVMVSTVASSDVSRYVGPSDICMMHSVTDVQGLNRISERVLGNAAHALAGMVANARRAGAASAAESKPAIGLTMFGVTTPCVRMVQKALEDRFDCLVFHATGTGGQSLEKLADSGLLAGAIDVTTTEVADLLVGGVFSAGEDRLGAFARRALPYVGSVGALDMVNFHAMDTVPARFRGRRLHAHNANVTLMRTTAEECAAIGRWIAERLNRMRGPVRFLLPEGGVSLLDAPGHPFHDPAADRALFDAVAAGFRGDADHRLVRLPHALNDPAFAEALVRNFLDIATTENPSWSPASRAAS